MRAASSLARQPRCMWPASRPVPTWPRRWRCVRATTTTRLAGQILIAPMLDPRMGSAAMREANQGGADCVFARGWQQYLVEGRHTEHPYGVPMAVTRLADVAPAPIVVAEGDRKPDEGH